MLQKFGQVRWLYISIMTAVAIFLCFFQLTRNSFTFDEVTSAIISNNWSTMWHLLWFKEGNMWLYFLILHFWEKLGSGDFFLRSLSAIFGILTVPVFYLLAKTIYSERVARIAAPLFLGSVYFIFYAQMARSYALALLLVTLSAHLFLKIIQNSSKPLYLFSYIIVTSLAMYTHLLVVLAIVTQYVYILIFPKTAPWKKIIIAWSGIFICIIPLILAPSVRSGHQLDWLQVRPFVFLPFGIITLSGDSLFLAALSGIIILILFWRSRFTFLKHGIEQFYLFWLMLWAVFPIFFSYVFSALVKPIYQPLYFNACLPAFILLVAVGLEKLRKRRVVFVVICSMFFAFSLLRIFQWYSGGSHFATDYVTLDNKLPDDWRSAAFYVTNKGQSTDAIIFYAYYVREPFSYYFSQYTGNQSPSLVEISSSPYDLGGGTKIPEPDFLLLDSLSQKYPRVWLVLENNNTTELGKKQQWLEIEKELQTVYSLEKTHMSNEIAIELWVKR